MIQVNNNGRNQAGAEQLGGKKQSVMFHYLFCIDYNNRTKFFKTRDTHEKATDSTHL